MSPTRRQFLQSTFFTVAAAFAPWRADARGADHFDNVHLFENMPGADSRGSLIVDDWSGLPILFDVEADSLD